jgi:RNA polymerase sigma-70 factor (ECF subfamily)
VALRADDVDLGRDRALVEQYQDGDIAAFEDLYRRYYGRLYRFCLRRMGDAHEAEEVTQEAFARAYRAMPALRGERRFYPWLSVIASRLCIDTHRRLGRTEPSAEIDAGWVEGGHERIDAAVDYALLSQAMERVSARHREVLQLRERQGWSYQRIADHYDISLGAVEGLLFRARQALRREFLAVAGPESGLAAGVPPVIGLGWLGRRMAGVKARLGEWASGWANLPALTANGVGLAMVATTAAGLYSVATGLNTPPPVHVVSAASPIAAVSAAPAAAAVQAAPIAAPATAAPTAAARPAAAPKPTSWRMNSTSTNTQVMVNDPGVVDRAEEDSILDVGAVVAGGDPAQTTRDAARFVNRTMEDQK